MGKLGVLGKNIARNDHVEFADFFMHITEHGVSTYLAVCCD